MRKIFLLIIFTFSILLIGCKNDIKEELNKKQENIVNGINKGKEDDYIVTKDFDVIIEYVSSSSGECLLNEQYKMHIKFYNNYGEIYGSFSDPSTDYNNHHIKGCYFALNENEINELIEIINNANIVSKMKDEMDNGSDGSSSYLVFYDGTYKEYKRVGGLNVDDEDFKIIVDKIFDIVSLEKIQIARTNIQESVDVGLKFADIKYNLMTYEDFVEYYNLENDETLNESFIESFILHEEITKDKKNDGIDYGLLCKEIYLQSKESENKINEVLSYKNYNTTKINEVDIQDVEYILLNACDYPFESLCITDYYMLDVKNNTIYHSGTNESIYRAFPIIEIDENKTNNIVSTIYNFVLNDCGSTKNLVYYGGDYIGLQDEYGFLCWDVDIITINNEIIQYDDYTMNEDILDLFIK